jgi:hypothetical protein
MSLQDLRLFYKKQWLIAHPAFEKSDKRCVPLVISMAILASNKTLYIIMTGTLLGLPG